MSEFHTLTLLLSVCGVIDGTHIKLVYRPQKKHTPMNYINKHHFYSVLLQGICDAKKLFWDVCVNAPDGAHDADHWNCSAIKKRMQRRDMLASPTIQIEGVTMHPHLIGDSSYPISPSLLKPYENKNSQLQTIFYIFLCRGCVRIENAFGIVKG
eukprot:Gb_03035 [translate_table: standard]